MHGIVSLFNTLIASKSMETQALPFWQGQYQTQTRGGVLSVVNPYSGERLAHIPELSEFETEALMASAASGFRIWSRSTAEQRARVLDQAAELLHAKRDFFTQLIVRDAGKPVQLAQTEVDRAVFTLRSGAAEALRFAGSPVSIDLGRGAGKQALQRWFPKGMVLAFSPFNFPLNLALHKVVPAIATGCSIVLKAPPQSPLAILHFAALLREAGLPEGVFNVMHCSNALAAKLVADPRFAVFSFTGSDRAGWYLKGLAGKKSCVLELGGNAAAVVDETADLHEAARQIAQSAFMYSGQVCISTQRVLVVEAVAERFRDMLLSATAALKSGDPQDAATWNGPMIEPAAVQRCSAWIAEARKGGAEILAGGQVLDATQQIFAPTVLHQTQPDMKVWSEEVFAPVLCLETVRNVDHGIELAEASRYGLQCGVFSERIDVMKRAWEQLSCGSILMNMAPGFRIDTMPYGGLKDSGEGLEGIRYAMESMSQPRLMIF
jgi:glyceraldehyde-3-phosphate dehydrogenase (NADP+)